MGIYKECDWKFDKEVVPIFESHVRKSVPMYEEIHSLINDISGWFIEDDTNVYDIGTSTGETLTNLLNSYPNKKAKYFGIDSSLEMIEKAKEKLKYNNVQFIHDDVTEGFTFDNASLTVSMLTMMFISEKKRQNLVDKIYKGLNKGGAFILVEKVIGSNARFNEIWIELYHQLKLKNDIDEKDVFAKSRAIRGVLKPYTVQENIHMLESAGFTKIDTFFKWNNFVGILCVK
ncbi:hypothetical protein BEH_07920 [Priestia filamentosa]|uniref:Methyltransferase domain-containing protein n=1 Tax=Priestia filamentosa TaxID=1402861 RepID=A0A0H4KLM5_9BACI|nr:methyltransferase domain-containing protein [Priestia filamentosa]AKO95007.2 hypothetical protein BEH_07920 [Priestia filamentosa]